MKFEVPTLLNIEITGFWDVTSCSLVDNYIVQDSAASVFNPKDEGIGLHQNLVLSIKIHGVTNHKTVTF
jgi:hypothetical protein